MHFSYKGFILGLTLTGIFSVSAFAQDAQPTGTPQSTPQPQASPTPAPAATPKPEKTPKPDKNAPVVVTADAVGETSIVVYGGRAGMTQIRKTVQETGKLTVFYGDGTSEVSNYQKKILRGENTDKDKWRVDHKFPSAEYSLVFNGKIFGVLGGSVFTPRTEAIKGFDAQIHHGLDTLLRYKEDGATLVLQKDKEKHMNVEMYVLDLTDKEGRKTRFFISVKTFRILSLEYVEDSVKYTRKFYDYRVAQGTLVPYRTVLTNGDVIMEESNLSTITYGQKVEEAIFDEN